MNIVRTRTAILLALALSVGLVVARRTTVALSIRTEMPRENLAAAVGHIRPTAAVEVDGRGLSVAVWSDEIAVTLNVALDGAARE